MDARYINIKRMLETFPERKFILVADTTSRCGTRSIFGPRGQVANVSIQVIDGRISKADAGTS